MSVSYYSTTVILNFIMSNINATKGYFIQYDIKLKLEQLPRSC